MQYVPKVVSTAARREPVTSSAAGAGVDFVQSLAVLAMAIGERRDRVAPTGIVAGKRRRPPASRMAGTRDIIPIIESRGKVWLGRRSGDCKIARLRRVLLGEGIPWDPAREGRNHDTINVETTLVERYYRCAECPFYVYSGQSPCRPPADPKERMNGHNRWRTSISGRHLFGSFHVSPLETLRGALPAVRRR